MMEKVGKLLMCFSMTPFQLQHVASLKENTSDTNKYWLPGFVGTKTLPYTNQEDKGPGIQRVPGHWIGVMISELLLAR